MEEKSKLLGDDDRAAAMEEASSPALPAPSSLPETLLLYFAEAYAGCLLLMCGTRDADAAGGGTDDDPAPAAAADDDLHVQLQAGADGGGKTSEDLRINNELLQTRRNKARPKPPGNPREGRGGGGGSHN